MIEGPAPQAPRGISDPKKDKMRARIARLLDAELAKCGEAALVRDFAAARRDPREVRVSFSGGITQKCWSVTRSNGDYRVIFLPTAGYFSLCVESDFGPLDIGVHGPALGCFASV